MRRRTFGARVGIAFMCTAALVLLLVGVLGAGRGRRDAVGSAVKLIGGVPVGVEHTRAGALAAADNYVALASQSIEQNPVVFEELVAQAYAQQARGLALAEAQRVRAGDPQNVSNYRNGGHGLAVVAARRLDSYTQDTAIVTSWLGGFVWGPHLLPRQTWSLVDTTLRWQAGRWLVVSSTTDATPAPVPSIVYIEGTNDRSGAFQRLAGMTAPFYGAPE
jgi:hypothetical protein